MFSRLRTVPVLVGLLLAAGCAGEPGPDTAGPVADPPSSQDPPLERPSSPRERPTSSSELPTLLQTPRPPSGPSDVIETSTITGTLEREGDCAELVGPSGRWVVLDLPSQWRDGDVLVVTGIARPERSTTCEGIPFAHSRIREAGTSPGS